MLAIDRRATIPNGVNQLSGHATPEQTPRSFRNFASSLKESAISLGSRFRRTGLRLGAAVVLSAGALLATGPEIAVAHSHGHDAGTSNPGGHDSGHDQGGSNSGGEVNSSVNNDTNHSVSVETHHVTTEISDHSHTGDHPHDTQHTLPPVQGHHPEPTPGHHEDAKHPGSKVESSTGSSSVSSGGDVERTNDCQVEFLPPQQRGSSSRYENSCQIWEPVDVDITVDPMEIARMVKILKEANVHAQLSVGISTQRLQQLHS